MVGESAKKILKEGEATFEVNRSGIRQKIRFTVKKIKQGNLEYTELFSEKLIGFAELQRISEEAGLPVQSQTARAFPKGMGIKDFLNL
ncbi:hypothetical protein Mia14_0954 [Candidatus Mancarchaeum acidiphilum]|uniref:Uncharacterized protein n=1 Tax=Candidatus Mancarchaeum acidiphilum TaxID=1920749 RepID=A0A218NP65_9ARCH|nr:hypothetical protein [Candidatus Mancarchaeum acidiphilum]ASI14226.1 hypothetical protein Mia14_0954 [Candidatus Mancarchaeum acidiphilum]